MAEHISFPDNVTHQRYTQSKGWLSSDISDP
jgi:hypothetical protein